MSGPEEENWIMLDMDYDEDDDNDDCAHFPDHFKNYMKTKLNWQHLKPMGSWVFWSEDVESESPTPIVSPCVTPNSESATLIANSRIKEKIRSLIQKLVRQCEGKNFRVLIQFWAPRTVGDRRILTTAGQPFGLSSVDNGLCQFRMMSIEHKFYVDTRSADDPSILGHVFRKNVPAFTPAVLYYSGEEYPQRYGALDSEVRASMAFPVIEPSGTCCCGVLELLATKEIYCYSDEVLKVLSAIQDVGLKYSDTYCHVNTHVDKGHEQVDKGLEQVLEEISKAVKVVCETHKLPFGQTWIPCRCCRDVELGGNCGGCYVRCKGQVLTALCYTKASYALDDNNRGFLGACSAYFLRKGQGVAGKALSSHSPCFCRDITLFSITEYPLVHLARMFGLTSCFAICLRSTYTGDADYVIEFFLPPKKKGVCDPRTLLGSVLGTMKQHLRSFKFASGAELGRKLPIEVIKFSKDRRGDSFKKCQTTRSPPGHEALQNREMVQLDSSTKQLIEEADTINNAKNGSMRILKRKNKKTEIPITKDVLMQHFGVQLDDAAQRLCVSRSTLKRACRRHGISQWPRSKRTKRDGSLAELKEVNESLGRAEGADNLTAAFHLPGIIASAQPENPLDEMLIEKERTSHDLINLCPAAAEACQQGLDLEPHLTVLPAAAATVLDAVVPSQTETSHDFWNDSESCLDTVVPTQPETSIGGAFTENTGTSHDFRNLSPPPTEACQQDSESLLDVVVPTRPETSIGIAFSDSTGSSHYFRDILPAVQARQQDSEVEFRLAIDSLPANPLSDGCGMDILDSEAICATPCFQSLELESSSSTNDK